MLCDELEGWDGGVGGRFMKEGVYVCMCVCVCVFIHIADSLCCIAETNIML